MDALVLPSRVVELLRRAAEEGGVSLEDFLMDVATASLDPPRELGPTPRRRWSFCGRLRRSSPGAI